MVEAAGVEPASESDQPGTSPLKVVGTEAQVEVGGHFLLVEIAREGARRMLVAALETEVAAHLEAQRDERDGHALRTSNVIESPFATVPLRQRVTKGAGCRTKGLLMAYKLLDMAQARWRRLDGAHLLLLVRAGISFVDGVQQEGKVNRTKAKAA